MIFLTIGNGPQFNRLIKVVDEALNKIKYEGEIVYQIGSSDYKPKYGSIFNLLSKEQYNLYLKNADFIICHAGEGIMTDCIKLLKKPIVMPRLAVYKEVKNDHQTQLAKKFMDMKLINVIDSSDDIVKIIEERDNKIEERLLKNFPSHIGVEIESLLERILKIKNIRR